MSDEDAGAGMMTVNLHVGVEDGHHPHPDHPPPPPSAAWVCPPPPFDGKPPSPHHCIK